MPSRPIHSRRLSSGHSMAATGTVHLLVAPPRSWLPKMPQHVGQTSTSPLTWGCTGSASALRCSACRLPEQGVQGQENAVRHGTLPAAVCKRVADQGFVPPLMTKQGSESRSESNTLPTTRPRIGRTCGVELGVLERAMLSGLALLWHPLPGQGTKNKALRQGLG